MAEERDNPELSLAVPTRVDQVREADKEEQKKKPVHSPGKLLEDEELPEEDLAKKKELELCVERTQDPDPGVQKLALGIMTTEIKSATSSMTSIPKPLKYLGPHYGKLKEVYEKMPAGENKVVLSDILSILAMTNAKPDSRESLKFKLSGSKEALSTWGHEYVRHVAGEIASEYDSRQNEPGEPNFADLLALADEVVPYHMQHNSEHEAVDLLIEIEQIPKILDYVDEANHSRVCLYMLSAASYVTEPDDARLLDSAFRIYRKFNKLPDALRVALRMDKVDLAREVYNECEDPLVKKQLAFMLARQNLFLEDSDNSDIITNSRLSEHFLALAQDLDIMEAKLPEDVYKSNADAAGFTSNVESARQNLASTFVNAFVNAGFGQDKLMKEDDKWVKKNKEHGMMSATASLGMINIWDVDAGLGKIDKFSYSPDEYVKAGFNLAVGVLNSGVRNECDPAIALLSEQLNDASTAVRTGAILGLGLAYARSAREDVSGLLTPILEDEKANIEVVSIAALALGMIFVGTCDAGITQSIISALTDRPETDLSQSHARLLCVGLGLLYLARQQLADVTLEMIKGMVTHNLGKFAAVVVESCAYTGTGSVLTVQKLLDVCGDHPEDKAYTDHQGAAVLGLACVTLGEDIGIEMIIRSFDHLLQYGDAAVRRAVPLALGLLNVSNPRMQIHDTLSKLSHDSDDEVAMGAIFALGLIGAGTNNSRLAATLRSLAAYYAKEANQLFIVRIAQGLVFLGKGTMTLAPYHTDRQVMSSVAVAGLLTVLHSCLDFKNIILSKSHYLLYTIAMAMYPRMLMTFDESLKPLKVNVRVGQAVDTVGQAGKPKTITGFQTHDTPVLFGYGDRAELATDEWLPLTSVLEGFVILKPNPDAAPKEVEVKKLLDKKK